MNEPNDDCPFCQDDHVCDFCRLDRMSIEEVMAESERMIFQHIREMEPKEIYPFIRSMLRTLEQTRIFKKELKEMKELSEHNDPSANKLAIEVLERSKVVYSEDEDE